MKSLIIAIIITFLFGILMLEWGRSVEYDFCRDKLNEQSEWYIEKLNSQIEKINLQIEKLNSQNCWIELLRTQVNQIGYGELD